MPALKATARDESRIMSSYLQSMNSQPAIAIRKLHELHNRVRDLAEMPITADEWLRRLEEVREELKGV